jgi:8-hydroxy-5-deazaflavin:NADPH oxidoreductase
MKIAMIGGGGVAQTLAAKLLANGHDVVIGIRSVTDAELSKDRQMAQPLKDWSKATGGRVVTLAEAAAHGEIVFNATTGAGSLAALTEAGADRLAGKILIDVANPLDFSQGMPPFLSPEYSGPNSLGESIQKALPKSHVVKAFNTIAAAVMVNPALILGAHDLFIAGNDAGAKATVSALATKEFGWKTVVDLGDIIGARASESVLPIWLRLWMTLGTPMVNLHVAKS